MDYNIEGNIFLNPDIVVQDVRIVYDLAGKEDDTTVSFELRSVDDSASMTLSDKNIPSSTKKQPIKNWVLNRLKEFEI